MSPPAEARCGRTTLSKAVSSLGEAEWRGALGWIIETTLVAIIDLFLKYNKYLLRVDFSIYIYKNIAILFIVTVLEL